MHEAHLIIGLVTDRREVYGDVYEERLKLWKEFNFCWLSLLQQQKEITEQLTDPKQPPPAPRTVLDKPFLVRLGDELVRLCDGVEQHGLVDYELGVYEEEIVSSK